MYRDYSVTAHILIRDAIFFFVFLLVVGMVANVNQTLGMALGGIWLIIFALRVLSLVLMVLIPALRITGGMIMECVDLLLTIYNMTIAPVIRAGMWVYRWLRQRQTQRTDHNSSSEHQQRKRQGQRQSNTSQDDEQEARFRRRQQQRDRDRQQEQQESHDTGSGQSSSQERSCFDILGVSPSTDLETAKRAYRERCKEYHPDKVAHLGPKLRAMAEQELKDINEAWRQFQVLYKMFH
jgi:DnaJ-domain-containing protein 1